MSWRGPTLVVFAKAPVIGGAKTRLAAGIGKVQAWRRHRAMTARILRAVQAPSWNRGGIRRWRTVLTIAPDAAITRRFPGVWPQDMFRTPQGRGDLGARQARALSGGGPTLVIGTDAPQIRRADIARAFAALKRHDAVIGPAMDGGYWLFGLARSAPPGLFEGVRWSHEETRSDLEAQLERCGLLKIYRLRPLRDVDHASDLGALKRKDAR